MNDENLEEKIVEGQIDEVLDDSQGSEVSLNTASEPQSTAELVISLTNLINANLSELQNIEKEMGQQKEMVDSVLANDAIYVQHAEAAKEAGLYFIASLESGLRTKEDFSGLYVDKFIIKFPEIVNAVDSLD